MSTNRAGRLNESVQMHCATLSRARQSRTSARRRTAICTLRRNFFAQAGESANRYHIGFERVLEHLWQARSFNRRLLLRSVTCVDDLVHAAACIDEIGLAWSDLSERYERALIRRCRGSQDEIQATIFVRRLFADLRRRTHSAATAYTPSLRCYGGMRPLRTWLADRLGAACARGMTLAEQTFPPATLSICGTVMGPTLHGISHHVRGAADPLPLPFAPLGPAMGKRRSALAAIDGFPPEERIALRSS